MTRSSASKRWRNWAGTATAQPARVVRPRSVDELAAEVRRAAADGLRLRAVGSGHSFTDAAVTDGVMVDMGALDRLVRLDAATGLVTVQGGATLHRLNRRLAVDGLALANLGDIDAQTISGRSRPAPTAPVPGSAAWPPR